MGNCWSKFQCFGSGSGNAHGSDPSTSQHQLANPPQAVTGNESSRLAFTIKDIAELEEISNYIQEVIVKHKEKLDPKVIPPKMVNSNLNQADHLLNRISREFDEQGTIVNIAAEAQRIVPNIFKGLADAQWVAAGIAMIVLVLERADQMDENKEKCLEILEDLGNLSSILVELLREEFPNVNDKLRKAIYLICEGVIWCDKHLQSGLAKRFAFVNINKDSIEDLTNRLKRHYTDLTLSVAVQTYKETKIMNRQTSMLLGSFKAPYPEGTVGLGEKVSEVLSQLGVSREAIEPGVRAILLHGMGGIGKTTLAKAVCAEIPITGKFVAQVELGEKPTTDMICNVQRDICERIFGIRQRIGSYEEGQEMLRKHLSQCRSPILLFVDNVLKQEDLSKLLPRPLHLPDKSRLIITARDSRISEVLNQGIIACENHLVQELSTSESEELFDKVVGGCTPGTEQQVATILELCGGLPLALEVVGRYLGAGNRKFKTREWDSTIAGIMKFQNINGEAQEKLNDILRWSYEQLTEGPKQVFLDISYLLRNTFWDWGECLGVGSELERLKDFSLVKKVKRNRKFRWAEFIDLKYVRGHEDWDADEDSVADADVIMKLIQPGFEFVIEVHDLLAHLGRHISEYASPRTRFFVNSTETFEEFLKFDQQGYHTIEGLVLEFAESKHVLPARMLDTMHQSLRILVLHGGVRVGDTCDQIPGQLEICSTRLDASGIAFPYSNISSLSKLRVLDIQGDVAFDFREVQFPTSLEFLQLRSVNKLHAFRSDSFEKCSLLHSLHISKCSNLENLPPSFCLLRGLRTLMLGDNFKVTTLPDFDTLQSLESVYIWRAAKEFPNGINKLVKLRNLHIHLVNSVPNDLDLSPLSLLENLGLCGTQQVKNSKLPEGLGNLFALETYACDCDGLKKLPSEFGGLVNLRILFLLSCEELEELPATIVSLKHLRKLAMNNCTKLEKLPANFGNLTTLESLVLQDCDLLKELPSDLGNLVALQELALVGGLNLEALPHSISFLKNLKFLAMGECIKLKKLPDDLGNLVGLEILKLSGCEKLEALLNNITCLTNLRMLDMRRCTGMTKLPNDFANLQARIRVRV